MSNILTEYSLGYLIICLILGIGYAWVLYKKDTPWSRQLNYSLAAGRALLVFLIAALLLGPYVKSVQNYFEKPTVVFAVDNSQSLPLVTDSAVLANSVNQLGALSANLERQGYEIAVTTLQEGFKDDFSSIAFDGSQTNLSNMLKKIQTAYENRNLADVILLSDGIYNEGISPDFSPYNFRISTIGIGDTLPQTDLNLKTVYANKVAYLGNQFPLVGEILNNGFRGKSATVTLKRKGKVLAQKQILFKDEESIQNVDFLVKAEEEGMQHYVMEVTPLQGEFTIQNNVKNIYIDILDSKENILIVAASPHPDIKAIRGILEKNENYDVGVYIPGLLRSSTKDTLSLNDAFDLVIFHQVPNIRNAGRDLLEKFRDRRVATWFIIGNQSDLTNFNQLNDAVNVIASGNQTDKVTPDFNNNFDKFSFENDKKAILAKSPPVSVPFGNFELSGNAEVILYQKVGSVVTNKPMLVVNEQDGVKSAVLLGEGIWQWKLQEFANNQENEAFEEMFSKLIQYLSTKEDKRKFRVYPTADEYFDSETIYFETEIYNEIYEKIYGQKINLKVNNESGEAFTYAYVNNPNFRYAVKGLPQGIYRYEASTSLNGEVVVSSGEFTVKKLEIEAINTTANFSLLRNLAAQTGGDFYTPDGLTNLTERMKANKQPDIIHSQEAFKKIISFEWLLVFLLILAATEWILRKIKGAY